MGAGGVLVAGLVVWALTRSVEPPVVTPVNTDTPAVRGNTTLTPAPSAGDFSIPANGTQEPDKAQVARISAEDLHAQFSRGDVTIVDVRDASAYATAHIPGSLNIPMASIQGQIDTLPKGKPIVAYCT